MEHTIYCLGDRIRDCEMIVKTNLIQIEIWYSKLECFASKGGDIMEWQM